MYIYLVGRGGEGALVNLAFLPFTTYHISVGNGENSYMWYVMSSVLPIMLSEGWFAAVHVLSHYFHSTSSYSPRLLNSHA